MLLLQELKVFLCQKKKRSEETVIHLIKV